MGDQHIEFNDGCALNEREKKKLPDEKFFVWQSIHVHFNVYVFVHQMLIHALPPFSALLSPSPSAQGFWRLGFPMSVINLMLMSSTTTYTIILYLWMEYYCPDDYEKFSGFLFIPLLYSFVWRASIAIKYASFSPAEYEKVLSVTTTEEIKAVFKQTFININYMDYEDERTLEFEILACGLRVGCNVNDTYFTIENPRSSPAAAQKLEEWKAFLTNNSSTYEPPVFEKEATTNDVDLALQKDGSYRISLFTVLKRVHRYTQNRVMHEWFFVSKFVFVPLCMLTILIPFYELASGDYKIESGVTVLFLAITVWELVFFQWVVIIRFALGCVVDMRRQACDIECFDSFIRSTDYVDGVIPDWNFRWPVRRVTVRSESDIQRQALVRGKLSTGAREQTFYNVELWRRVEVQGAVAKCLHRKLAMKRKGGGSAFLPPGRSTLRILPAADASLKAVPEDHEQNEETGHQHQHQHPHVEAGFSKSPRAMSTNPVSSERALHSARSGRERSSVSVKVLDDNFTLCDSAAEGAAGGGAGVGSEQKEDISKSLGFPRLCLSLNDNLFSWLQATLAMQKFKLRFRKRIEAYAIVVLAAEGAVVLGIVDQIFTQPTDELKLAAFQTPLFFQTILTVFTLTLYIVLYLIAASQVNYKLNKLLVTLSMQDIGINKKLAMLESEPEDARFLVEGVVMSKERLEKQLKQANESLDSCIEMLKINQETNPVEVFGIKAELGLAYGFFTVISSFFIMLAGVYVQCAAGINVAGG